MESKQTTTKLQDRHCQPHTDSKEVYMDNAHDSAWKLTIFPTFPVPAARSSILASVFGM